MCQVKCFNHQVLSEFLSTFSHLIKNSLSDAEIHKLIFFFKEHGRDNGLCWDVVGKASAYSLQYSVINKGQMHTLSAPLLMFQVKGITCLTVLSWGNVGRLKKFHMLTLSCLCNLFLSVLGHGKKSVLHSKYVTDFLHDVFWHSSLLISNVPQAGIWTAHLIFLGHIGC